MYVCAHRGQKRYQSPWNWCYMRPYLSAWEQEPWKSPFGSVSVLLLFFMPPLLSSPSGHQLYLPEAALSLWV